MKPTHARYWVVIFALALAMIMYIQRVAISQAIVPISADLHLNKAQAGRYLGYGVRTAHRFWDGDAKVPAAVALLLRALIHFHEQPEVPPYEGIKAKRKRELAEKLAIAP